MLFLTNKNDELAIVLKESLPRIVFLDADFKKTDLTKNI